jgi:hypothetical protein
MKKATLFTSIAVSAWAHCFSANSHDAPLAPADRCYGALIFQAIQQDGSLNVAAWVVGPFATAECVTKLKVMQKITPSPIQGGHVFNTQYGPAGALQRYLWSIYQCVHQDMPGISYGPDHIGGIYLCAPSF